MKAARKALALLGLLAGLAFLGGCATAPTGAPGAAAAPASAPSPADPWESLNRKVWGFNDAVDSAVVRPLAQAYETLVPSLVRAGVTNVFGNVGDLWSAANHLLQGKFQTSLEMGLRVVTNTVFGLGGLLDPASEMGLKRRSEDFGQTLGRWGLGSGPYLVLPLLGPSTLRDAGGLMLDRQFTSTRLVDESGTKLGLTALGLLDTRAGLLSASKMLDSVALDKYTFVREAFLSRRLDAVHDGSPPLSKDDGDPGDSAPAPTKK
jgi:phospholipid-binding lipoprotein MlaA